MEYLPPPPRRKRGLRYLAAVILAVVGVIIILLCIRSCSYSVKSTKTTVPVTVATARVEDVPVYLSGLGAVRPTDSVTIISQISGILLDVLYKEGQMVKAGDLLAKIDPRPYLAQLKQFEGQLQRDLAQLANAQVDLKRYQTLYPKGAVSQQVYATQIALVKQLEGTVKSDQGQVEAVKVNLIYTQVISPIDGRIGLRLVDPGNYVQPTTALAIVNSIQPITVEFALPEDNIPDVTLPLQAGKKLLTKAYDRSQHRLLETGILLTLDNQVNPATGTFNLKALFENKQSTLFPNQFINIDLQVNTLKDAIIVPTAAIQQGPQGAFVFLLNANKTVKVKPVTTSVIYGEYTVINSGITANQQVVTEGAEQLKDGAKVTITPSSVA